MNRFEWVAPTSLEEAVGQASATVADAMLHPLGAPLPDDAVLLKAGGMDLLDLMKEDLVRPARIVHLRGIAELDGVRDEGGEGVRLGANVTLAELADHSLIRERYRALADAALHTAHPQVRNVATLGGNLAQRPKCWYFRQADFHCLRKGGEACYAIPGEHAYHAVFDNRVCAIVHPSTAATALVALGATIELQGSDAGDRRNLPLERFFVSSGSDPRRENVLRPGELITAVRLPPLSESARSAHVKQAERESFDWSVADAAVLVELDGAGTCTRAAVVLGAAAPVPWRAAAAEAALVGQPVTDGTAREAARRAVADATPLPGNAYKLPMLETVVRRALSAGGRRLMAAKRQPMPVAVATAFQTSASRSRQA